MLPAPDSSTSLPSPKAPPSFAWGKMMNDAGLYVANAPIWWDASKMPDQPARLQAALLKLLPPGTQHNGVLLFGEAGRGKSSAALGLAYAWGKAGHPTAFHDFGELMLRVKATWNRTAKETTEDIHKELMRPALVILDDVGKQTTPESLEFLSTLINARINRGRPTIPTTNHDLRPDNKQGIEDFCRACDARIYERYQRFHVAVQGENLRIKP